VTAQASSRCCWPGEIRLPLHATIWNDAMDIPHRRAAFLSSPPVIPYTRYAVCWMLLMSGLLHMMNG
jgi:hypothetical protein